MGKVFNGVEEFSESRNVFKTVPALVLYLGAIHFNLALILWATVFLPLSKGLLFVFYLYFCYVYFFLSININLIINLFTFVSKLLTQLFLSFYLYRKFSSLLINYFVSIIKFFSFLSNPLYISILYISLTNTNRFN